ncbi:MAG: DUF2851 family protein [Ignavibacteria bacterium]|nr:DUF2851 family protein [Ignavibacteria bacterium]
MTQQIHIPEEILVDIWKNQSFNRELRTETGEKLEVMYVGDENTENGGPDFINARIKIGNLTYLGDIEIDNTQSDWRSHGHNLNKRFNKVVLHAIVNNESHNKIVYSQDGRRIDTFCIAQFIEEDLLEKLRKLVTIKKDNKTNKIHCYKVTSFASDKEKIEFLTELGLSRFKKKCERMISRLRELIYLDNNHVSEPAAQYAFPGEVYEMKLTFDELNRKHVWAQLFYEDIFEALGYSQNKQIMLNLAQAVDLNFLRSTGVRKEDYVRLTEAVYFTVGGLLPEDHQKLPDDAVDYLRKIQEQWNLVCDSYTGKVFHETEWHFANHRPQNYPTLRIAAGARISRALLYDDLIGVIIRKFTEIHSLSVLKNSIRNLFIIKSDGFWQQHFTFQATSPENNKYFLGTNRADEIFVNVILPFLYIYFDLFGKPKMANRAISLFTETTIETDNHLVREVADSLQLNHAWNKAVISQGMIELFRNYCAKDKCEDCLIGQKVFAEEY